MSDVLTTPTLKDFLHIDLDINVTNKITGEVFKLDKHDIRTTPEMMQKIIILLCHIQVDSDNINTIFNS